MVYIRATPSSKLEQEVSNHPRFITREGHHFLWRDLYPLLAGNSNPLISDVCKGFEIMGFLPPLPAIGTLSDFNSTEDHQNRAAFKELWRVAADYGLQRGWRVETNKNAEMYYSTNETCPAYQVFVSPSQAERFLIRLTLRDEVDPQKILAKIEGLEPGIPFEVVCSKRLSLRNKEKVSVNAIDITTSLCNVIGETEDKGQIQALLLEYVRPFMELI